jgi:hypothetical protein
MTSATEITSSSNTEQVDVAANSTWIRDMFGSNLGKDTCYPRLRYFVVFFSHYTEIPWYYVATPRHFLSNSYEFIIQPIIERSLVYVLTASTKNYR